MKGDDIMKKSDWKVFKCHCCGKNHGYFYMPPLSKSEDLRKREIEEYERDFNLKLEDDGQFHLHCECGQDITELPYEEWDSDALCEILSNMLEDNNRHNMTGTPNLFWHCMEQAGISDDRIQETLRHLLDYYSETQSMQMK